MDSKIKPFRLPYEYQRGGIPPEKAKMYNCRLFKYNRKLNDKVVATEEAYFFNKEHFDIVLKYWNKQGDSMARTPNPVDGKIYHWQYEAA